MDGTVRHESFRKILFCTDFSENADRAFVFAVNAAVRNAGCELHLLHVVPEPPAQFWKVYIDEVDEDLDALAKREIDAKVDEVYRPRVPAGVNLVVATRVGEARHEILEYAQQQDIDLIVLGRQGAGAMGKILFGNVTERIVHKADCPVLVIPPPVR